MELTITINEASHNSRRKGSSLRAFPRALGNLKGNLGSPRMDDWSKRTYETKGDDGRC